MGDACVIELYAERMSHELSAWCGWDGYGNHDRGNIQMFWLREEWQMASDSLAGWSTVISKEWRRFPRVPRAA